MEKNRSEITGNISSIGELKEKSNGKQFMYINVAQNTKDGKPLYHPVYLDGVMLDDFNEKGFKVGDRINVVGMLEPYKSTKDNKTSIHIRPFTLHKIEREKNKERSQDNTKKSSMEVEIG